MLTQLVTKGLTNHRCHFFQRKERPSFALTTIEFTKRVLDNFADSAPITKAAVGSGQLTENCSLGMRSHLELKR